MNPFINRDRPNPNQENLRRQENQRRELNQTRQSLQHEKLLETKRQEQRATFNNDRATQPRQDKATPRDAAQAGRVVFQRNQERNRNAQERERVSSSNSAARRESLRTLNGGDESLFNELLERPSPQASIAPVDSSMFLSRNLFTPSGAQHASGSSSAMAMWQPLEAELGRIIEQQPSGPVSMTLMLPRLGNVDARLHHTAANGWDISLRFSPQAMSAMEAHQERCRQMLRRRLACRVRLQFEQREVDA